eukprot:s1357_g4.t1
MLYDALIQVMVWLVTIETLSVTSLASSTGRGSRGLKVGQRFVASAHAFSSGEYASRYNHWWTTGIAVWTDFMVLKFCWMMSFGYPFSGGEENFWRCDDGRIEQARRALKDQQLRNCYALFYQIRATPPGDHKIAN